MNTKHAFIDKRSGNLDFKDATIKEHFHNRFTTGDGDPVRIVETEYGNVHVRDRGHLANGQSIWFMRGIFATLADAVQFCAERYFDHGTTAKDTQP